MWNRLSCVVSVVDRVTVSRLLLLKNANIWEAIALMWKCGISPLLWVCEVRTPSRIRILHSCEVWDISLLLSIIIEVIHCYYNFLNNGICVWTAMVVMCQICISGSYLSGQDIKADALHILRFRKYWRIFFFSPFLVSNDTIWFANKDDVNNAPIVKSCPSHRISLNSTHSSPREAITVT